MLRTQIGLLSLAFLVAMSFQTYELVNSRSNLEAARSGQQSSLEQGQKLRSQLDALASGAARLASAGDVGAQAVIEQLRRDGITVRLP